MVPSQLERYSQQSVINTQWVSYQVAEYVIVREQARRMYGEILEVV